MNEMELYEKERVIIDISNENDHKTNEKLDKIPKYVNNKTQTDMEQIKQLKQQWKQQQQHKNIPKHMNIEQQTGITPNNAYIAPNNPYITPIIPNNPYVTPKHKINISEELLANAIINPTAINNKLTSNKSNKIWDKFTATGIFPKEFSLEELLPRFKTPNSGSVMKSCLETDIKLNKGLGDATGLVNQLRRMCMEYNAYKQYKATNLTVWDNILMELNSHCPPPGIVIIEAVQRILSNIALKNAYNIIPSIEFTYFEYKQAVNNIVIEYEPTVNKYIQQNKVPEGDRLKELLIFVAEQIRAIPTGCVKSKLSWKKIFVLKQQPNMHISGFGNNLYTPYARNNRGRIRGRARGGRGRGRGGRSRFNNNFTPRTYGIKQKLIKSGLNAKAAQEIMDASKENNFCIDFNYFQCKYGEGKCRFKHTCGHCGRKGHIIADCNDNTVTDNVFKQIAQQQQQ